MSAHREPWPVSAGSYVRGCRCDGCKAKRRAYYEANREEIAAKKRAYYEANREEIAAKKRAYREANPGKSAACKAWRERRKQWPTGTCHRCGITGTVRADDRLCRDCIEVEAS